ncbi:MAG: P1 family peptidase [Terriglobales bacterium]
MTDRKGRRPPTLPRCKTAAALAAAFLLTACLAAQAPGLAAARPRTRDLGIITGILPPGRLDAITDVPGVEVGQVTLDDHDNVHTGVTAILPHAGNMFQHKVPGAVFVGNAFGKLMGSTQIRELGRIETPILLTNTLNVPRVADALLSYMMQLPGNERVQSINPVVGETNDGYLNDIRGRHVDQQDVFEAIENARGGPVEEGSVGAGAGTVAFGFKGGIGTASRKLPANLGGWTVGVLVQTNFGGILNIDGAPVGRLLGRYYLRNQLDKGRDTGDRLDSPDGSCMIIVATNAPVGSRNLRRMAARTMFGLARTGSAASNGSGDYAIAFSTVPADAGVPRVKNRAMSPLFLAVIEATQEAIYNSLFKATTVSGRGHTVEALPLRQTEAILRDYHVMH